MEMNVKLKEFLKSLSIEDADVLWDWLDDDPFVIAKMATVIAETHPTLNYVIEGDD